MEKRENHLNILSIYKETKDKLTVNEYLERENIDKPLMLSFLKGESIPFIERKEKIVSPFLLLDIENETYYPFIFCSVLYENNQIKLSSIIAINNIVKEILKKESIDIELNDIVSFFDNFNSKLDEKMLMNKYALIPFFSFFDEDIIEYNSNYPFISSYLFSDECEKKYDSLFKEVKSNSFEKKIMDESYGFNARKERIFKRIEKYSGTRVISTNPFMIDSLILDAIDEYANKNESVLLVYPDERKEKIDKHLKETNIENIFDHSYTVDVDKIFQIKKDEEIKLRYQSFQNKKNEIFKPLNKFKDILRQKIEGNIIDIDFSSYTYSDYEKDKNFFDFLNSKEELLKTNIKKHHYYSLSCENNRDSYSSLQLRVLNIISSLSNFINELKDKEYLSDNEVNINSIYEFKNLLFFYDLISKHLEFSTNTFKNEEISLDSLKEKYKELSKTELVLKKFLKDDFFDLDLNFLFERKGIFKNKKIKKTICSYLKQKDYKKFYKEINDVVIKFNDIKKEIENILPKYISIYGEKIKTFNGLNEIETEIAYKETCKEFMQNNDVFSFSNPLVKKVFSNEDFRHLFISDIEKLKKTFSLFIDQYKEYESFFIKEEDIEKENLDDVLDDFKRINLYSFQEFSDYLKLQEEMKNISLELNEAISIFEEKERKLEYLETDFLTSLVTSLYSKCKESFTIYENDYENIKREYISSLERKKENYINSICNKIKQKYINKNDLIELIDSKELYEIEDNQYDNVIVFMSESLDDMNLLSTYRVGRKHMFISYSTSDKRILGFHETRMSENNLFFSLFNDDSLSMSFIDTLKEDCKNNDAELILDSVYPYMIKKDEKLYAIYPTFCFNYNYDQNYIEEMTEYLASYLDIKLISFDAFEYLLYKKGIFEYIE